jgi:hypothetical protein
MIARKQALRAIVFLGALFESKYLGVVIETYRTDRTEVSQEGADPMTEAALRDHGQVNISRFKLPLKSSY